MRALLDLPVALPAAVVVLVVASCGGQQATPTAVTVPVSSATSAPIASAAAPELGPVAPPDGLIATIVLTRPHHTLDAWSSLVKALGVPKMAFDLDDLAKNELGAHVVAALDLDAPVDVVVLKGPGSALSSPGGAVSVALNPGEAAMDLLSRSFDLEPKSDGSIAIRRASDGGARSDEGDAGDDDEIADDTRCVIAPSTGSPSRRIVCAYGSVDLGAGDVVPYLTRTLAREPPPSAADFRAEFRLDKQRDAIKQLEGLAGGSASSDKDDPAEAFGTRFATEASKAFVDDLDAVVLEATTDDQAVSLSLALRFGHATSPLTKALLSNGDGPAAANDAFWRLPADTTFAAFSRGATAIDLDACRTAFFPGLETLMTMEGAPRKYIDLEMGAARAIFLTGGPMVIGAGFDSAAARTALDGYVALGKDTLAARTKARAAMQGWTLVEVDEPASKWTGAFKDMAAAEKITFKKKKTSKTADADKEDSVLVVTPTPASLGLPPGTFHLERRTKPLPTPPKKVGDASARFAKAPPIAHTTHVFVVPDGASTWLAFGEDATLVAAHVKASLSTAPATGTMKGKVGLDQLVAPRTTSGAFATIGWMAQAFLDDDSDADLKDASSWLDKIAGWPSRGETPIETYVTPLAPGEGGLGGRNITLRLPIGALGDLVQVF